MADSVIDTVQDGIDTGVDWAQDGIHLGQGWLCRNAGEVGCTGGNVLGGLLDGGLAGLQDTVDKGAAVTRDVVGFGSSVLRLDLARAVADLGSCSLDFANLGLVGARWGVGGYLVGGVVDAYERDALRRFVSDLVNENFTGGQRTRVRRHIGLDGGQFGLPLHGQSKVLVLDSDRVPLAKWHRDKHLDLYALAGLLSTDSFSLVGGRTVVKIVGPEGDDSSFPVGRLQISRFLETDGNVWRLRVYALSRQAVAEHLATATAKCQQLGLRIDWDDRTHFAWFRSYNTYEITDLDEFTMAAYSDPLQVGSWMHEKQGRSGGQEEDCTILTLGAFNAPIASMGLTVSRTIDEGEVTSASCSTRARNDGCCNTILRSVSSGVGNRRRTLRFGSGVVYKDAWPHVLLRYVLAHEIGHYVGLCHFGHDGIHNVMFTKDPQSPPLPDLKLLTWGTTWGYYRDSEPRFSLADAENCWRFIIDQMPHCLDPQSDATPVE